jgi:hypothetical protein
MLRFLKNIFIKKSHEYTDYGFRPTDTLPEEYPDDLSIELVCGNGFNSGSTLITLQHYGSRYFVSKEPEQSFGCFFEMSGKDMKDIFIEFKNEKFDKVEMEETTRLDYPSTTLTVRWNHFFLAKSVSQIHTIKENSPGNFYSCIGLVQNIAKKKVEKNKYPVKIIFDEDLLNSGLNFEIHVDINQYNPRLPWYESRSGNAPETLMLMPGTYLFKIYLHQPDSSFLNKKYKFSEYILLSVVKDQSSSLYLSLNEYRFPWKIVMERN